MIVRDRWGRGSEEAVSFVRGFFEQEKPVEVICHGPWTLVEAGVVKGRRLASFWTLQTDIRSAGGEWVDEEVVIDQGLVTSRNPDDLSAFNEDRRGVRRRQAPGAGPERLRTRTATRIGIGP